MRYYINSENGYIDSISTVNLDGDGNASAEQYAEVKAMFQIKPTAESGYDYRLKADLSWEKYELPQIEETETAYTAEQLEQMTSTELREICSEMGISGTMTKANMIQLILGKQSNSL